MQNDSNSLPQALQGQNSTNPQGGRGVVEVAIEVEVVEVEVEEV